MKKQKLFSEELSMLLIYFLSPSHAMRFTFRLGANLYFRNQSDYGLSLTVYMWEMICLSYCYIWQLKKKTEPVGWIKPRADALVTSAH